MKQTRTGAAHCALLIILMILASGCGYRSDPTGVAESDPPRQDQSQESPRPNILVIVVDDFGYNDLGVFGSEIETPNIDALANAGVLLTNFHASPNCSPTRAMLLSGTDTHLAGLGNMFEELAPNQRGKPGYEGFLNTRVAALPELLQDDGYRTYMTGKWHLGLTEESSPAGRGFDKSFAMLQGGAGAFSNMLAVVGPDKAQYREDGKRVEVLPPDFYSTQFYTTRMIDYIDGDREDDSPFFAYLAYTAAHWPLQAPETSIKKYHGRYDAGYDKLRETRLRALKDRGFFAADLEPPPRHPGEPAWGELTEEQQRYQARLMEIYAAMIDDVDVHIGRLISYLKAAGEYDNTLIFFMSDNGPEGHYLDIGWDALKQWVESCCDNSYENLGGPTSYAWYGPNWAQAGNTPLRMFKGFTGQGGLRVPAFFHYPRAMTSGLRSDAFTTVKDVMPTLLEAARVSHPGTTYKGREVHAMQGVPMTAVLAGTSDHVHAENDYMGWELFSKRAIVQGNWKIIYLPGHELFYGLPAGVKTDQWQLYNLAHDPGERHDLAASHPEKLEHMIALWEAYVRDNNVILPDAVSGY